MFTRKLLAALMAGAMMIGPAMAGDYTREQLAGIQLEMSADIAGGNCAGTYVPHGEDVDMFLDAYGVSVKDPGWSAAVDKLSPPMITAFRSGPDLVVHAVLGATARSPRPAPLGAIWGGSMTTFRTFASPSWPAQ